jgi:hypothetical protein
MKSTTTAAMLLGLASLAAVAAPEGGGKPPILQHRPEVVDAIVGANACGADWKRVHLTPTSVTCEFKPRGAACGAFGGGTPLQDGNYRRACAAPTNFVRDAGQEQRDRRCGSGWRLVSGSVQTEGPLSRWQCEPDPSGIKCPSGWAGPNRNTSAWTPAGPVSMICQVPPK